MISKFEYIEGTRSFAEVPLKPQKQYFRGFKFNYPFKGKLAQKLMPMVAATCYKFMPYPPVSNLSGEDLKSELRLITSIKMQCKEVPVIMCKTFDNACYIHDLDKYLKEWNATEVDIRELCNEFGMDYREFMSKLGPHMVIVDYKFESAPILAHEFGHYLNTIGKGEVGGQRAHERYESAASTSQLLHLVSNAVALSTWFIETKRGTGYALLASSALDFTRLFTAKPLLKAEWFASTTGLKNLKKAGASDVQMELYWRNLSAAFGTYSEYYKGSAIRSGLAKGATGGYLVYNDYKKRKAYKNK